MINDTVVNKISDWLGTGSINIFGWPFSGKDTQGKKLAQLFKAELIGGGEIMRNRPDISKQARQTVDTGYLAPTDEFLAIVTPYLGKPEYSQNPIILSSLGRWHGEEKSIVKAAKDAMHPIKAVVYLVLDERVAQFRADKSKRAQDRGQRADDASEYLQTRFAEFKTKTLPVIEFYRDKGLLVEVDGNQSPEKVTAEIINKLATLADNT